MRDHDQAKDGRQKGPQEHAEGQHGERTHARFLEELHSRPRDDESDESTARGDRTEGDAGR